MNTSDHLRQADRLTALRQYAIVDTPREEEFDSVVELLAEICETPIALMTLVEADRQWFKAEVGFGARETGLESSICSRILLEGDVVEIPDTWNDRRTTENPLCVTDPAIRFYAGAVLRTSAGVPLGSLCVLDHQPRTLTPLQRRTLRVLGAQVMKQLDLRLALRREDVLRREIDHRVKNSLQTMTSLIRLQRARLPHPEARDALDAVIQRLDVMSLLHKELHQASHAETVELSQFIAGIGEILRLSAPANVAIEVQSDEVRVGASQASASGIIISEFVANSMRHAFPANQRGTVQVEAKLLTDGRVRLVCSDDGVGSTAAESAGLGLKIIEASAGQIGGTIDYPAVAHGVRAVIEFPLPGAD